MTSPVVARLRQVLLVHRRVAASVLTFLAVLFALLSVTQALEADGASTRTDGAALARDDVLVPVPLVDDNIADLLAPGMLVDVVAAGAGGSARVIVNDVVVSDVGGSGWAGESMVVVAATEAEALTLAAETDAPLSVFIHPPK